MAKRVKSITSLLKKGAVFNFTPTMEAAVRALLEELTAPPILVFPDWDAVIDKSRPFRLHFDASTDGLGATLEQEQPDGSIRPIVYISRATLSNERNWTPMELEAGWVVWSIRRLRRYLFSVFFLIFTDHECLQQISKIGKIKSRIHLGTAWHHSPTSVLGGLPLTQDDFRTHRAPMPLRRRAGPLADASVYTTHGPYPPYAIDDQLEPSRTTRAGRTRSRTAILAGHTPLRPDNHRAARSGFAAPAAPALPPRTQPRSSPLPRSDRLGSTTPLGRPGLCRPPPAPNSQIDTTPPAPHTCTKDDTYAATKQLSKTLLSYSHHDWDKAQRADPLYDATRRYIQLGHPDPPPQLSLRPLALTQEAGDRRHHRPRRLRSVARRRR